ncbi:MAG: recombinase family protein [Firmicutes bacterium]|nr:recombinase family protein [Bacillota bacterium]
MKKEDRKFTKNVALYSRKSKFTGKGESIDNQIEMCKEYLRINFPEDFSSMNIVTYEDEGYSGGNTNRPQFQKMLKDINDKKFDTVICYRLDRISRNTADFAELMKKFEKLNISFISIRDRFDTSTPTGKAMMMMVSVFAQLERDTIAERIRDNMQELAKTGRWLGGTTPTGYKSHKIESVTLSGKKKSAFMLEIKEDEIEIIKCIFSKFLETNSLTKTETYLMNNGIISKNNRRFSRFTIKLILENPVYMIADKCALDYFKDEGIDIYSDDAEFDGTHGIMAYNKTKQITGSVHKKNGIDDWIIAVGKHIGIISGKDWVRVQKMLDQNKSKTYRKPRNNIALLSGILVCGKCGAYMRPKKTTRTNKENETVYYYLCETKDKSQGHLCDSKNINGNVLDKLVCNEIKKLAEDNSEFFAQLKTAKTTFSSNTESREQKIKDLEKRINQNTRSIQGLVSALLENDSDTSKDYINKEIERLDSENKTYKERIDELKCLNREYEFPDCEAELLKDMILSFAKTFDMMDLEEKRKALRRLVKRIVWDGKDIHLYFVGSNFDDIKEADCSEMFSLGDGSK